MATQTTRRMFLGQVAGAAAVLGVGPAAFGRFDAASDALNEKAVAFLKGRQEADGSWSPNRKEPGITAMVVTGLLQSKRVTVNEPVITKGLTYLEGFIDPAGGLPKAAHANYSTAIALMAFKAANSDGRYDATIRGAQTFLNTTELWALFRA